MPLPGRDSQRLRIRLPEQQAMPDIPDLYKILSEAERQPGKIVELPWFVMDTFQSFALTVEFEAAQQTPLWSLYERLDDNFRMIWTCRDTDVYLLHDILSMFMAEPQSRTIRKDLKIHQGYEKSAVEDVELSKDKEPDERGYGARFTVAEHVKLAGSAETGAPAAPAPAEARQADDDISSPAEENEGSVDSSQLADEETQSTIAAAQESEPVETAEPDSQAPTYEAVPAHEEVPAHEVGISARESYFDQISEEEFQELKEKPNLLLGRLLVESGAIPEGLLDAALKLQEMVRIESLTPDQSIDAMRRAYHRTAAEKKADTGDAADSSEGRLISELLYEAGIISRDDIEAACRLKAKRGEELNILRSSGKIDKRVEEAALNCLRLMRKGLIRHEQAVIAVNYSHRSRVPLNEAFIDLGWDYPY